MTHNEARISNERLDEQGLLAAGIAMAKLRGMSVADEVDQRMFGADAGTVIRAYLQALRSTPVEAEGNQAKGQVQRVFALENAAGGNQPFAWHWSSRNAQFSFPVWVIGAARPDTAPANAIALYARPLPNPSPSDGEVSEAIVRSVIHDLLAVQTDPRFPSSERVKSSIMTRLEALQIALQSFKRGQP